MNGPSVWLTVILISPLAAAVALFALRRHTVPYAGYIAAAAAGLTFAVTGALIPSLRNDGYLSLYLEWIPSAHIGLALRLDWLGLLFLFTEAAVTLMAIIYAWGYHRLDERTPYFYGLLLLFSAGMAGTVLADDLFLFYIFWEFMLIASWALIMIWGEGERKHAIGLKYFVFTHVGSLLVLVGLLFLYNNGGTAHISDLAASLVFSPAMAMALTALFVIGFSVKMAIFPLHLWLPDAHTVAPMPVTVMLAAAMLSMGTYGLLRFPLGVLSSWDITPFALPMMIAGVVSEIYGAIMALSEKDIKRIIAYSSVSQMGYILFGLGTLTQNGMSGALLQVIYHALAKALLFMCAGLVIHATKRRALQELGGLASKMPLIAFCTAIGALTIAGTPPLAVFGSEWLIFSGGFQTPYPALSAIALLGSLFTVAYALWLLCRVFLGPAPQGMALEREPRSMVGVVVALAALALIAGFLAAPLLTWINGGVAAILRGGL